MTAITGLVLKNRNLLGQKPFPNISRINPKNISIVIPVMNNQNGINRFLRSFFDTQNREYYPREIIIVDNNSEPNTKIGSQFLNKGIDIHLFHCKTRGPGNARNVGWKRAKGEWILFTDSDCLVTESLISGFLKSDNGSIGYAGNVKSIHKGPISTYYELQKILVPLQNEFGEPEYLITANALVYRKALECINGFNPRIRIAAGEDVDMGIRLRAYGKLTYCPNAIVRHDFVENINDFKDRFTRYGKGNRIVGSIYGINMLPKPFQPSVKNAMNNYLSAVQYHYLKKGYDSVKNPFNCT
jgi:glycosyltransferase involved in cell wall biosynthesis